MFFCSLSFFFFFCFCFVLCFNLLLLRASRRQKPSSDSYSSMYARQAQQNTLQSTPRRAAKDSRFVSTRERQCKHADNKEQKSSVAESHHVRTSILCFFLSSLLLFLFCKRRQQFIWIFPSTADSQPCDEPPSRLYSEYYFWSGISVTGVTKNSGLFAVTSTTCSTLLLAVRKTVFFHPSTSSTPSVRADSSSY